MRNIASCLLLVLVTTTGCLVRTRSTQRTVVRESCPPAHHWDGGACVHNGHHHDHDRVRDHR